MDYRSYGSGSPELLRELITLQKRELRHARFISVLGAVILALLLCAAAVLAPRILNLLNHAEVSLRNIDTLASDATTLVSSVSDTALEAGQLVHSANALLAENTEDVAEALDKLNSVDFQRLNDAIDNLAAAAEPLAKLGRLFS